MDIAEIRRGALATLINDRFGCVARKLALAVGKPERQINDILAGRASFGEKIARQMEEKLALPRGFFDGVSEENNLSPSLSGSSLMPAVAAALFAEIAETMSEIHVFSIFDLGTGLT